MSASQAKRMHVNELGAIPVLMYHRVVRKPSSSFDRSPAQFLADLRRLYREGYRPVRAIDLVRGRIDVQAGKSPVVLTFDDSSREQAALRPDGRIDPHSAVGLLLSFARSHRGFRPVATMFVNALPFGTTDGPRILRMLHARGFELGNHTYSHADLSGLSASEVRKELARGSRAIRGAVPEARVRTLALPLGEWPQQKRLASGGSWHGIGYRHLGVFLVGAGPAPSPFSKDWLPQAIPRIQPLAWNGGPPNYGSGFWLDHLRRHPEDRYVSDGDPGTVTFRRSLRHDLAAGARGLEPNPYP
jgi:peptidoglycan/xylan/chitin deacetylase (PgdA/CDA1 family)